MEPCARFSLTTKRGRKSVTATKCQTVKVDIASGIHNNIHTPFILVLVTPKELNAKTLKHSPVLPTSALFLIK
jgi:hypothetical protein